MKEDKKETLEEILIQESKILGFGRGRSTKRPQ